MCSSTISRSRGTRAQKILSFRIEDESIAVVDADCPDLVCVKTGKASKKGDVIACLPHKLLIEVK